MPFLLLYFSSKGRGGRGRWKKTSTLILIVYVYQGIQYCILRRNHVRNEYKFHVIYCFILEYSSTTLGFSEQTLIDSILYHQGIRISDIKGIINIVISAFSSTATALFQIFHVSTLYLSLYLVYVLPESSKCIACK